MIPNYRKQVKNYKKCKEYVQIKRKPTNNFDFKYTKYRFIIDFSSVCDLYWNL